jgi:hypothetical protein
MQRVFKEFPMDQQTDVSVLDRRVAPEIHGIVQSDTKPRWVKLEGCNTPATNFSIK